MSSTPVFNPAHLGVGVKSYMLIVFGFIIAVLGAAFGSFITNWMDREEQYDRMLVLGTVFTSKLKNVAETASIFWGRSICIDCGRRIRALDLVPVLSFLALKARCRYCRSPIPKRTFVMEIAGAVLFTASFYFSLGSGLWAYSVLSIIFVASLFIFFSFDFFYGVIPDAFAIISGVCFLALSVFFGDFLMSIAGAFAGYIFFVLQHYVTQGRAVGMGDAYVGFFLGAALGLKFLAVALIFAYVLGAVVSLGLIVLKIKKRSDTIPFAVFLAAGGYFSWFFGNYALKFFGYE